MEIKNKLYKNIGIHVISTLFTVDNGEVKILLIRRSNNPYNGYWALPGGALYNNELLLDGAVRELREKTGLSNISLEQIGIFDRLDRSNLMRMIGISFLGVIDIERLKLERITNKTIDADYFSINNIPEELAYDHREIIDDSLNKLKDKIVNSNILNNLFPDGFTLPELQDTYETVLNKKFDRRNFRKKLLGMDIIYDTNKSKRFKGNKPAKLYKFKDEIDNKNVF